MVNMEEYRAGPAVFSLLFIDRVFAHPSSIHSCLTRMTIYLLTQYFRRLIAQHMYTISDCFLPRRLLPRRQTLAKPRYVTITLYVRLFRFVTGNERRHAILWMVLRSPKTVTIALSRFGPYFEQSFRLLCDSYRLFYSTSKSYLHTFSS